MNNFVLITVTIHIKTLLNFIFIISCVYLNHIIARAGPYHVIIIIDIEMFIITACIALQSYTS